MHKEMVLIAQTQNHLSAKLVALGVSLHLCLITHGTPSVHTSDLKLGTSEI